MTATTDFIAELYRAANEVKKITPFETRRLIERAVATIRDLREQVIAAAPVGPTDVLEEIEAVGRNIAIEPDQLVAHAMLEAADMIRTLKTMQNEQRKA